jgi:hypothetical protein
MRAGLLALAGANLRMVYGSRIAQLQDCKNPENTVQPKKQKARKHLILQAFVKY